jgi:hypothetical protein
LDGNDNPAPDRIEWYHRKQGKHNAFSGIMMIKKKRSKIPSFDNIFNANYRFYLYRRLQKGSSTDHTLD